MSTRRVPTISRGPESGFPQSISTLLDREAKMCKNEHKLPNKETKMQTKAGTGRGLELAKWGAGNVGADRSLVVLSVYDLQDSHRRNLFYVAVLLSSVSFAFLLLQSESHLFHGDACLTSSLRLHSAACKTSCEGSRKAFWTSSCKAAQGTSVKQQVGNSRSFSTGSRRALVLGNLVGSAALFVGSAAAVAVVAATRAMASAGGGREATVLATRHGMQLFAQGDVKGSVVEFDKALELDPRQRPYLWQRGLSLYYLNRFEEGAAQFRDDVAVNPNDTEESIWCFLCDAQLHGPDDARKRFLDVGRDSRPVMRAAYELFKDGGDTKELLTLASANAHDFFYAHLYVGLYHEAKEETEAAKNAMITAVSSPYGSRSGDYMATLAKVHCACRGWPVKESLNAIL